MLALLVAIAADPSVLPPPGLEWLTPQLVAGVEQLPVVGHWLVVAFQYVGFVTALFTAATVFSAAALQAARGFAWAVGLTGVADSLDRLHSRVYPYLAYLSVFNVPPRAKE
jgi:hypothetical protein